MQIHALFGSIPIRKDIVILPSHTLKSVLRYPSSITLHQLRVHIQYITGMDHLPVSITYDTTVQEISNISDADIEVSPGKKQTHNKEKEISRITNSGLSGVGIDIEEAGALPEEIFTNSYQFFRCQTFHPTEVAHALCSPNPLLSLLGIFAAKEALIKAFSGNALLVLSPRDVRVVHSDSGKPMIMAPKVSPTIMNGLSISHSQNAVVAIFLV